ncbi:MAG: hypothetical protein M1820_008892 [Bogoriella megaspora]|nr:MAG: hypothetical protein M1820_008892 [Bogoriella megaspora]
MGGFVFDSGIHSESEKIFPEGHEKLAIGPRTLVRLAKNFPTSIPDISESHIRDKSNGNALAKAIVCTQAIWFLVQCVVRLSSQLPISLLELNTAAHCICTMVTYAFWWSKPLDIEEPSNVSGDETRGYCAALYVSIYEPELVHVADLKTSQKKRKNPWSAQLLPQHLTESGATQVLYARQIIHDFHYKPHLTGPCHCSHANCNTCCHGKHDPRNGVLSHWRACRTYDARDARRWALASEFHRTYSWINRPECFKCIKKECWRWILPRLSNRPHVSVEIFLDPGVYSLDEILRVEINAATVLVALVIAGAVYGGLHLIAWDAPFTSTTQSTLWRLSAVTIAAAAPYFYLDTFLVTLSFETWPSTQQWRNLLERLSNKPALRPSQVLLGIVPILDYVPGITSIMFYAARLMYGLARIFLVVESFISFAYLPIGVFQEPQWTYYFPHIL